MAPRGRTLPLIRPQRKQKGFPSFQQSLALGKGEGRNRGTRLVQVPRRSQNRIESEKTISAHPMQLACMGTAALKRRSSAARRLFRSHPIWDITDVASCHST